MLPFVLGFCHSIIVILKYASADFFRENAGYHGGCGTSAPCSIAIAWAGRGLCLKR